MKFYLTKTHAFHVGQYPILTADLITVGTQVTSISYSASLPYENRESTRAKTEMRATRKDLLKNVLGKDVINRMSLLREEFVGNCAETLNFIRYGFSSNLYMYLTWT